MLLCVFNLKFIEEFMRRNALQFLVTKLTIVLFEISLLVFRDVLLGHITVAMNVDGLYDNGCIRDRSISRTVHFLSFCFAACRCARHSACYIGVLMVSCANSRRHCRIFGCILGNRRYLRHCVRFFLSFGDGHHADVCACHSDGLSHIFRLVADRLRHFVLDDDVCLHAPV